MQNEEMMEPPGPEEKEGTERTYKDMLNNKVATKKKKKKITSISQLKEMAKMHKQKMGGY